MRIVGEDADGGDVEGTGRVMRTRMRSMYSAVRWPGRCGNVPAELLHVVGDVGRVEVTAV